MREFRPFVRDGMGNPYLPGTSIKGAIRTAVLYRMLLDDNAQKQMVVEAATSGLRSLSGPGKDRAKKSYSEKWLQERLLQTHTLPNAKNGPNTDILRCLKVGDAYPVNTCHTRVIKIQFLSKRSQDGFYWSSKKQGSRSTGQPLELWVEALVQGTFKLDLVWDRGLFNRFKLENREKRWPICGLDDVVSALSRISQDVAEHERGFFSAPGQERAQEPLLAARALNAWYERCGSDVMRIGFGSGMLSTTVNLRFPPELREKIRDACGHPRPGDPAPKSRRVWKGGDGRWYPMGWLSLTGAGPGLVRVLPPAPPPETKKAGVPDVQSTRIVEEKVTVRPRKPEIKTQVILNQTLDLTQLKKQVDAVQPNDKLALERVVGAIEGLDRSEQREAATYIKEKLEKASLWKKNPLRFDLEVFLSEEG
jgi:CRISPR-associated protein Csm5